MRTNCSELVEQFPLEWKWINQGGKFRHLTLLLLSFDFPLFSQHFQTDSSMADISLHFYHHDKLRMDVPVLDPAGKWPQVGTVCIGEERALLESHQGFFCVLFFFVSSMSETGQGRSPTHLLPSPRYSLRAPPGRLVFLHDNYLLFLLFTHAHTHLLLLGQGSTGHTLFRLYLYYLVIIYRHMCKLIRRDTTQLMWRMNTHEDSQREQGCHTK